MLKKFAVALIATSLIAGPALAQGNTTTAPAAAGQPAKVGVKSGAKSSLNTHAVNKKHVTHKHATKKHVAATHVSKKHVAKHHAKKVHVSKSKHFYDGKALKRAPAKPIAG